MTRNPAYSLDLSTFKAPTITPYTPDQFAAMGDAMRRSFAPLRETMQAMVTRTVAYMRRLHESYNTPLAVSGVVATYQVRAGADPRYRTPEAVGELVRDILRGKTTDPKLTMLYAANRRIVACAVLRGWVVGHPEPAAAWDRRVSATGTLIEFRPVYRYEQSARA